MVVLLLLAVAAGAEEGPLPCPATRGSSRLRVDRLASPTVSWRYTVEMCKIDRVLNFQLHFKIVLIQKFDIFLQKL